MDHKTALPYVGAGIGLCALLAVLSTSIPILSWFGTIGVIALAIYGILLLSKVRKGHANQKQTPETKA
jgi:hypothetical protein